MKIGNTPGVGSIAAATPATREGGSASPAKAAPSATSSKDQSATVQLSSAATALLDGADGGFDAAKVDRVRSAISKGTYKINADVIADKLIANAKEVLGKVSSSS